MLYPSSSSIKLYYFYIHLYSPERQQQQVKEAPDTQSGNHKSVVTKNLSFLFSCVTPRSFQMLYTFHCLYLAVARRM